MDSTSEMDDVFLLNDTAEAELPAQSIIDVMKKMSAISRLEKNIEDLSSQADEVWQFYQDRIKSLDKRIDFLKSQIREFLKIKGLTRLVTPRGTCYITETTSVTWPEDERLVTWLKDKKLESYLKTEVKPDKLSLLKHLENSEDQPPGFTVVRQQRLAIRK